MAIFVKKHDWLPLRVCYYKIVILSHFMRHINGGGEGDMIATRKYCGDNIVSDIKIHIPVAKRNELKSNEEYFDMIIDIIKIRDPFFFEKDEDIYSFRREYYRALTEAYPQESKVEEKKETTVKKESPMDLVVDMYKDYESIVEKSKKILDKIQTMSNEYKNAVKKTEGVKETS